MKSSKQKVTPPSQLDRMFQVATRAPLSLSQLLQSHALMPAGNSVPLASEAYYPWISSALDAKGIPLGHLIRQLSQGYETINFRIAHPSPKTHIIDLADPFHPPIKVKPKLHQTLEKIFQLDETKSKALGAWLVDAFLQNHIPSALVITSECRHDDPKTIAHQNISASRKALGRLAVTNLVMAFSIFKKLSPPKIDQLNELRTGMVVEQKQVGSSNEAISELIRRPIIVAAAPAIHESQLEIEMLAALLDAAVTQIRQLQEQAGRQVHLERAVSSTLPMPSREHDEMQGPGP